MHVCLVYLSSQLILILIAKKLFGSITYILVSDCFSFTKFPMQLDAIELATIKFITTFYWFLWPAPFKWNFQENLIKRVHSKGVDFVYILGILGSACVMISSGFNAIAYPLLMPEYEFKPFNAFILLAISIPLTGLLLVIMQTYTGIEDVVSSFNAIFKLEEEFYFRKKL